MSYGILRVNSNEDFILNFLLITSALKITGMITLFWKMIKQHICEFSFIWYQSDNKLEIIAQLRSILIYTNIKYIVEMQHSETVIAQIISYI
jgi:hypothetical protein